VGSIPITRYVGVLPLFEEWVGGIGVGVFAVVAQLVEYVLGKDEVMGSSPINSLRLWCAFCCLWLVWVGIQVRKLRLG
jgi:hypothetical protein